VRMFLQNYAGVTAERLCLKYRVVIVRKTCARKFIILRGTEVSVLKKPLLSTLPDVA